MIQKFGVGTRLYLGFALIVVMLMTLLVVGHDNFSKLNQANDWSTHGGALGALTTAPALTTLARGATLRLV